VWWRRWVKECCTRCKVLQKNTWCDRMVTHSIWSAESNSSWNVEWYEKYEFGYGQQFNRERWHWKVIAEQMSQMGRKDNKVTLGQMLNEKTESAKVVTGQGTLPTKTAQCQSEVLGEVEDAVWSMKERYMHWEDKGCQCVEEKLGHILSKEWESVQEMSGWKFGVLVWRIKVTSE